LANPTSTSTDETPFTDSKAPDNLATQLPHDIPPTTKVAVSMLRGEGLGT